MYCRTCATEVDPNAVACVGCGVRPLMGRAYCPTCGKETPNPDQEICLSCGVRVRSTPTPFGSTSDILYRASGGVMLISSLWNMFTSFILFLSLIWVCVGVFWIIPGLLSVIYASVGIATLVTGNKVKPLAFAPGFGLLISLMNLNIICMMLDVLALVLGGVGYAQVTQEEAALTRT